MINIRQKAEGEIIIIIKKNWNAQVTVSKLVIINKVETPIHDNIRELVTWECKEHGVKS